MSKRDSGLSVLNLDILKKAREEDDLESFHLIATANPARFLRELQKAMDLAAREGDPAFFNLFNFRYAGMQDWHEDLAITRHSEPIVADLEGALENGYREFVMEALDLNVSPYDWETLLGLAGDDEELVSLIEDTQGELEAS